MQSNHKRQGEADKVEDGVIGKKHSFEKILARRSKRKEKTLRESRPATESTNRGGAYL